MKPPSLIDREKVRAADRVPSLADPRPSDRPGIRRGLNVTVSFGGGSPGASPSTEPHPLAHSADRPIQTYHNIRLKSATYVALARVGTFGETTDAVVQRLVDHYLACQSK